MSKLGQPSKYCSVTIKLADPGLLPPSKAVGSLDPSLKTSRCEVLLRSSATRHVSSGVLARGRKRRSRREFVTTVTDDIEIAAPAMMGFSSPSAASGIAAVLY